MQWYRSFTARTSESLHRSTALVFVRATFIGFVSGPLDVIPWARDFALELRNTDLVEFVQFHMQMDIGGSLPAFFKPSPLHTGQTRKRSKESTRITHYY